MSKKNDRGLEVRDFVAAFADERSGTTAIEYGIIAGSLSVAIVASVNGVGSSLNTIFTTITGLF